MAYNLSNDISGYTGATDPYSMFPDLLKNPGFGGGGFAPTEIANTPTSSPSTSSMGWASMLAGLATAFAPEKYNRWGQKIPSWQEKLGTQVQGFSRAQMQAKALAAKGGSGGVNPMLMYLMLSQGGR